VVCPYGAAFSRTRAVSPPPQPPALWRARLRGTALHYVTATVRTSAIDFNPLTIRTVKKPERHSYSGFQALWKKRTLECPFPYRVRQELINNTRPLDKSDAFPSLAEVLLPRVEKFVA